MQQILRDCLDKTQFSSTKEIESILKRKLERNYNDLDYQGIWNLHDFRLTQSALVNELSVEKKHAITRMTLQQQHSTS